MEPQSLESLSDNTASANGANPPFRTHTPDGKLSPEFLKWARQEFNVEEAVAALRELRENGGLSSEEILAVLDEPVDPK